MSTYVRILYALTIYRRRVDCFISKPRSYRAVNTSHLGYKNQPVMLYGAEVLVCFEINTKHINTVWAESVVLER
jgi:hypothetical protein